MSFVLTNNFLLNARGVTFFDSTSVSWAFDKNANKVTATVISAIPAGANPTASVGLAAVNGSASTFMRSDAAPALSVAITPTWSGLHTFGAGLTISAGVFTLNAHTLALSANATVGGTNTGDQTLPVGANPTASVGLAAVNGSASTWMRSDAAPALSVAIVPTWSGQHTFSAAVLLSGTLATIGANTIGMDFGSGARVFSFGASTTAIGALTLICASSNDSLNKNAFAVAVSAGSQTGITIGNSTDNAPVTHFGPISTNGVAPPAKVTGWGTPTGGAVVASYNGALATLIQTSNVVAQLIADLKAFGLYGA